MSGSGAVLRGGANTDVEAIKIARESLFQAFNATDIDAFMAQIADDVVLMSHGGPPALVGGEAVRSDYKEFFDKGPFTPNLSISSDEVFVSGDWAFDRGTWVVIRTYKRGARRERLDSCYVIIWHRQPTGTWKLARIIWNGAPVPIRARGTDKTRRKPRAKRGN